MKREFPAFERYSVRWRIRDGSSPESQDSGPAQDGGVTVRFNGWGGREFAYCLENVQQLQAVGVQWQELAESGMMSDPGRFRAKQGTDWFAFRVTARRERVGPGVRAVGPIGSGGRGRCSK